MMWVIAVVLVVLILVFQKFKHLKESWMILVFALFLVLVYFSMTAKIQSGELDFSSPGQAINSIGVYAGWLGQTALNVLTIGKDSMTTVGNVILNRNQTDTNT